MARRFEETVNIQQQNLNTGFEQQSNSLINRLESFKNKAVPVAQNIAAQQGQAEAQQTQLQKVDGVTQAPKKKEKGLVETFLTGGVSTKAYNAAMQTSYLASLGRDATEEINKLEAENPDNIIEFNEKVAGYANGIVSGADPAVRNQVQEFVDGKITNSRNRVYSKTIAKNKAEAEAESFASIESFGNDAATLAREGNVVGAGESLMQAHFAVEG